MSDGFEHCSAAATGRVDIEKHDVGLPLPDHLDRGVDLGGVTHDWNSSPIKRDGFYAYVDTLDEAWKLFVQDLDGTLQTVAIEAKIQVSFDPGRVQSRRLVGFENRGLADEDFYDDSVDAVEIGAGHTVTAL